MTKCIAIIWVRVSISMFVLVPPEWIVKPHDMEAVEGQDVFFPCRVSGVPEPTIIWRKLAGKIIVIIFSMQLKLLILSRKLSLCYFPRLLRDSSRSSSVSYRRLRGGCVFTYMPYCCCLGYVRWHYMYSTTHTHIEKVDSPYWYHASLWIFNVFYPKATESHRFKVSLFPTTL